MINYKTIAIHNLTPLGGVVYDEYNDVLTITDEGVEHGYDLITDEDIQSEIDRLVNNQPILDELGSLDTKVVRALEDLIPESDTYNYEIVLRKRELRSMLL